jgi:hypothetical protein
MNRFGAVIGLGETFPYYRAFLYDGENFVELLPPGCKTAEAWDINDSGVVVGGCYTEASETGWSNPRGFLYDKGVYTELCPPGWEGCWASFINKMGVVVGDGEDAAGNYKVFVYNKGAYTELAPSGLYLPVGLSNNNMGVIIGMGSDDNGDFTKSFMATPQPCITDILAFFESSVSAGTLQGNGQGRSSEVRLTALRNMLRSVHRVIRVGDVAGACSKSKEVHNRVDGQHRFVKGPAAAGLANMVLTLRSNIGCP